MNSNIDRKAAVRPVAGETIVSGHRLVDFTWKQDTYTGGMYPHGPAILVSLSDSSFTPFVVWNLYTSDGGTVWHAEYGEYFVDLEDAVRRYKERGGRFA